MNEVKDDLKREKVRIVEISKRSVGGVHRGTRFRGYGVYGKADGKE